MIDNEDLFSKGATKGRLPDEKDCYIKRKRLNVKIDVVLIHDAYLKLRNMIYNNKVMLSVQLFDERKPIEFQITSIYKSFRMDNVSTLTNRSPYVKHLTKQKIQANQIKHRKTVRNVKECYLDCRENDCGYFNLCSKGREGFTCELSGQTGEPDKLEIDNQCDVFEMKNLNLFDKHERKRFVRSENKIRASLDDCATRCLNRKDKKCKSIVHCGKDACELTDQHMEAQLNKVDDDDDCAIYSSKCSCIRLVDT